METKKKVYISGQITGLTQDEYHDLFGRAEAFLLDIGHDPLNPLKVLACEDEDCNPLGELKEDGSYLHSWYCYLKNDLKAMLDCDAIVLLPNWRNSRGAQLELDVARKCGMQIFYFDDDLKGMVN